LDNTVNTESGIAKNPFPNYKFLFAMMRVADSKYKDDAAHAEWDIINILKPAGFSQISTLYEKEGDSPSQYSCTDPLNEENFNKYLCGTDILITHGHGGTTREVWHDDNHNEIVDDGEVNKVRVFILKDLLNTQSNILLWIDNGCENIKSATSEQHYNSLDWPKWYEGRTVWHWNEDNWVSADDALRAGIISVAVGSTAISSYGIDASVLALLISYHRTIGEWLDFSAKEKYATVDSDSYLLKNWKEYYLRFNILGDPSFSLFDDSLTICADMTPPTIQITSPSDNSISNNPEITISGTVSDAGSGIKRVEINSNSATCTNNFFSVPVKLKEGENIITVKVVDKADNETTTTLNIVCDTAVPQILIGSPDENRIVNAETISVSGSVLDENIDTVTVNGKIVEVDTSNKFFTVIKLQEGKNLITIITIDKAGNKSTKIITITYQKQTVITLQPDNAYMTVNGVSQEIDPGRGTKPVIIPEWSRTVVPIRAIVEALGGTIGWDGTERKVTINFKGTVIELWIDMSTGITIQGQ